MTALRIWRRGRRRPAIMAVLGGLALVLASASPAMATWSDPSSAAATMSTATVPPPSNPGIANESCTLLVSASVRVSWTAAPAEWLDGYRISLGTISGGPYTTTASVGPSATSAVIGGLAFSTRYYAVVASTKAGWTSVPTAEVSVVTPSSTCG